MSTLDAKILTEGKSVISDALLGITPAKPHEFRVGDEFGFDPDSNDTAVRGTEVFLGNAAAISSNRLAEDTVRYVCTISEQHGPFTVGNIVLYMVDNLNRIVPFISVVLPVPVTKLNSDPTATASGFQVPGSRLVFNITLKHSDEIEIASVDIVTPNYAQLPTFETEADVPAGASLTFKNAVISYHTVEQRPVLMTVDGNGIRWGMPYYQQINDPDFGHLDGGDASFEHQFYDGIEILFGYFYLTPESVFTYPVIGGGSYAEDPVNSLGNATYLLSDMVVQTNWVPN